MAVSIQRDYSEEYLGLNLRDFGNAQDGVMATSAYFALLNIFFVSLEGLISQQSLRHTVLILGLLGALSLLQWLKISKRARMAMALCRLMIG